MNIYQKLVEKFGRENRKMKCIEELSELIQAIAKDDRANVLEEMTQVRLQLKMIEEVYGFTLTEVTVQNHVEYKQLEGLL